MSSQAALPVWFVLIFLRAHCSKCSSLYDCKTAQLTEATQATTSCQVSSAVSKPDVSAIPWQNMLWKPRTRVTDLFHVSFLSQTSTPLVCWVKLSQTSSSLSLTKLSLNTELRSLKQNLNWFFLKLYTSSKLGHGGCLLPKQKAKTNTKTGHIPSFLH